MKVGIISTLSFCTIFTMAAMNNEAVHQWFIELADVPMFAMVAPTLGHTTSEPLQSTPTPSYGTFQAALDTMSKKPNRTN